MEDEYQLRFYKNSQTGQEPIPEFLASINEKSRSKIGKYIEYLRLCEGYLDEPYSRHITGKIRELRVDFSYNHYRIFYFTFIGKTIILLHGFTKKTDKTPDREIKKALGNYYDTINNPQLYE